MKKTAIAIHGGAGTIRPSSMTPEKEQAYKSALEQALMKGEVILEKGGSAIEAVHAAVCALEDCELFNAGKGSVFNATGGHEMDAAIMCGKTLDAGAVAGVKGTKNPIDVALKVMIASDHVFLLGEGAETFARQQGCQFEEAAYFFDQFRYDQWQQIKDSGRFQLDHSPEAEKDKKFGTVGAVALDQQGNLAAATSTGGMTNKQFGRVGDSPIIGAGNYARNSTCAVSCTGDGEFFIRAVAAYDVSCLMEYKGLSLEAAARETVHSRLPAIGGEGGVIAVDQEGNVVMDFNSEGMYRACKRSGEAPVIAIYKEK